MITLLKHLNSVHAKSSIAGAFMLILILFSVSCSNTKDGKIESSVATFDECIYPRGAVIYRNYLIIVGENTSPDDSSDLVISEVNNNDIRKIFVYNLETNKADPELQSEIFKKGIKWLYVRNDSLFGRFSTENDLIDSWSFWDGKNWIETHPFSPAARFETSYLRKECGNIFEDNHFLIYSYNQGEFGNAVLFLDKSSGEILGFPLYTPRQVIKDSSGYIVFGRLDHMVSLYSVIHIKHPEKLPKVPDSLIMYDFSGKTDTSILLYLDIYLKSQMIEIFSDSITIKTQANSLDFECFNIFDAKQIYLTYDSMNYSANDVVNLIKQDNTDSVGEAIFMYQSKLYIILIDEKFWYLCEMNNLSQKIIQDNYIVKIPKPRFCITRTYFGDSFLFVYSYSDMDSPCMNFTCLIINDNFIKTYHFIPD
ncbi:MAG: hypothetical protein RB294_05975 [Bacteroidales bacterium]|nr:hypothetical protein [Bacteroidales bacterium]